MIQFLFGVMVGAAAAIWYKSGGDERLRSDPRMQEVQDRANAILRESRLILEETRNEMRSAIEAGKQTVQEKATPVIEKAAGRAAPLLDQVNRMRSNVQHVDDEPYENSGTGPMDPTVVPSGLEATGDVEAPSLNEPLIAPDDRDESNKPGGMIH